MQIIKSLFWSSEQHRPQAFWRIAITILLVIICVLILVTPINLAGFLLLNAGGPASESMLPALNSAKPVIDALQGVASLAGVSLAVWLGGRFIDRRKFASFGFNLSRRWWTYFAFGLGLGALLMALIFGVELAAGWIKAAPIFAERSPGSFALEFVLATLFFVGVGIYEELLFRGYLIKNIAEGTRAVNPHPRRALIIAYLVSSALFGLAHMGNDNATWISTLNIALAGLMLGLPYLLTGELATSIGLHIAWNLFQGNVFGFPVSGGNFAPPTVIAIQQGGPDILTGGAFGPEAGLIGLAAMLVGAVLTLGWVRWQAGHLSLSEALPEYVARSASLTTSPTPECPAEA